MIPLSPNLARQQLLDTVIELTHLSRAQRAIVVGGDSLALCVDLQYRGFLRVVTPGTCPVARGQHTIGIIAGPHSMQELVPAIASLVRYLDTTAVVAVLIDSLECGVSLKVRALLEQLGFRIEAGVRCQQGFVLSARRQNAESMAKAA